MSKIVPMMTPSNIDCLKTNIKRLSYQDYYNKDMHFRRHCRLSSKIIHCYSISMGERPIMRFRKDFRCKSKSGENNYKPTAAEEEANRQRWLETGHGKGNIDQWYSFLPNQIFTIL